MGQPGRPQLQPRFALPEGIGVFRSPGSRKEILVFLATTFAESEIGKGAPGRAIFKSTAHPGTAHGALKKARRTVDELLKRLEFIPKGFKLFLFSPDLEPICHV